MQTIDQKDARHRIKKCKLSTKKCKLSTLNMQAIDQTKASQQPKNASYRLKSVSHQP